MFYVNLPVGAIALVVVASVLNIPHTRRDHSIDYLGAALLVAATTSLLLYLSWAGPERGWFDGLSATMLAAAVVLAGSFVLREARASEPILPLSLFRNPVVSVATAIGFVVGFAMFGAIVFVPVYLQVVDGVSPTESGLRMLPLMLGILVTSILSGKLLSSVGRYKIFPILGTAGMALGMFLLSRLTADSSGWAAGLAMLVVGLGLGFVMQVLIIVVQNAVDFRIMGVATSTTTFFRAMGGTIGIAVSGALLSSRLDDNLRELLPAGAAGRIPADRLTGSPEAIQALPPAVKGPVIEAFVQSLHVVFLASVPVVVAAFALSLFLKELPLRTGHDHGPAAKGVDAEPAEAVTLA